MSDRMKGVGTGKIEEGAVSRLAKKTAPGKSNREFPRKMAEVGEVVESFTEETNNWFEIIDVRTYRGMKIGIPCRYRWTIKRWAANDMDQWLVDNGWTWEAHLKADSRDHRENEMEARYKKYMDDYMVYMNAYVEFTNDVFEALNEGQGVSKAREKRSKEEKIDEYRERLRSE